MLASTGDGGGRNTWRDYICTCLLGSSLIISWTFRILAHEEDQYTDFLYIALKQTEAGPQSMGTRFLIFARRTNSRIQEFRENDSYNSATEEKYHEFKTS